MEQVRVSIIIPMKNEEANIGACLESIQNNTYGKELYEIICIDNGSSDSTVEIAEKYIEKVLVVPDATISYLRNFGAKKAKGEYIAFIDADCIADQKWLEEASRYFDREEPVCFGSTPEVPVNATWVQETWYNNKKKREEIQSVEWLESMNLFVKKEVFVQVGGFNENLQTCEDVDLCYRIKEKHDIISDKKIKVIHLGEARTLSEFFSKEVWRGTSNLKGLSEHGFKWKELPSILLPIYYLTLPIVFIGVWWTMGMNLMLISIPLLAFSLPLALAIQIARKVKGKGHVLKGSVIYLTYFVARAVALIR